MEKIRQYLFPGFHKFEAVSPDALHQKFVEILIFWFLDSVAFFFSQKNPQHWTSKIFQTPGKMSMEFCLGPYLQQTHHPKLKSSKKFISQIMAKITQKSCEFAKILCILQRNWWKVSCLELPESSHPGPRRTVGRTWVMDVTDGRFCRGNFWFPKSSKHPNRSRFFLD